MITSESVGAARWSMPKVTIIQRIVPHYRVPFFKLLNERLTALGVAFNLVYGQEYSGTVPISIPIEAPWAVKICNCYVPGPGGKFVWQPAWSHAKSSDLIIVEQASAYLLNYWLLLYRRFGGAKVAYWGQGVNVRAENPNSIPEQVKSWLLKEVDWWFAYTALTYGIVEKRGFSADRITVVENAVDNEQFRGALESVTERDVYRLKNSLGITTGPVGLYCGAFIPPKRIDFLIDACHLLKRRFPGLHVVLMGSGPEEDKGRSAAAEFPWIHYVGPKFDGERAVYFKASEVLLQPGTIGLVSIDSFVAGLPLFTTVLASHGPEITFIRHGENGFIAPNELNAYVDAVCNYLKSDELKTKLKNGCLASAKLYTMDNMADKFSDGIVRCLSAT